MAKLSPNVSQPDPLLTTKLDIPPVRPDSVRQSRLIERLNAGLHRKLTLISAPAGFGKTTLISKWLHASGALNPPLCATWLTLDDDDNDPVRFLTYFIAALETVQADVGADALAKLRLPQPPLLNSVPTVLVNSLAPLPRDLPCEKCWPVSNPSCNPSWTHDARSD